MSGSRKDVPDNEIVLAREVNTIRFTTRLSADQRSVRFELEASGPLVETSRESAGQVAEEVPVLFLDSE